MATVESIAIVTGDPPLKLVPDKPVPMVKVLVVDAVMVPEAPSATVWPLNVTDELVKLELAMLLKVLVEPLMVTPENEVSVPPRLTVVEPITTEELVRATFGMLLNVFALPLIDLPVKVPGMSSLTSKRKVVGAAAPDSGPAYT